MTAPHRYVPRLIPHGADPAKNSKIEYEEWRRTRFSDARGDGPMPAQLLYVIFDRTLVSYDMRTGIPPVMRKEIRQGWIDARQEAARQTAVREMLL